VAGRLPGLDPVDRDSEFTGYLCCIAVFGLLISDAVIGESSVGLWIGLAFGIETPIYCTGPAATTEM
jgi:hypothetical protein